MTWPVIDRNWVQRKDRKQLIVSQFICLSCEFPFLVVCPLEHPQEGGGDGGHLSRATLCSTRWVEEATINCKGLQWCRIWFAAPTFQILGAPWGICCGEHVWGVHLGTSGPKGLGYMRRNCKKRCPHHDSFWAGKGHCQAVVPTPWIGRSEQGQHTSDSSRGLLNQSGLQKLESGIETHPVLAGVFGSPFPQS